MDVLAGRPAPDAGAAAIQRRGPRHEGQCRELWTVSTGSPSTSAAKYVELLCHRERRDRRRRRSGSVTAVGQFADLELPPDRRIRAGPTRPCPTPASPGGWSPSRLLTPFGHPDSCSSSTRPTASPDHTVINWPVRLGNGYSIAPASPAGEIITGTSGIPAVLHNRSRGRGLRGSRPSGNTVGVSRSSSPHHGRGGCLPRPSRCPVTGGTAGTTAWDVHAGSVFNVHVPATATAAGCNSRCPSPSGDVVSLISVDGDRTRNIRTFLLDRLDAGISGRHAGAGRNGYSSADLPVAAVRGERVAAQGDWCRVPAVRCADAAGVQCAEASTPTCPTNWTCSGSTARRSSSPATPMASPAPLWGRPAGRSVINLVRSRQQRVRHLPLALPPPRAQSLFKVPHPLFDIPTWSTYDATAGLRAAFRLVDPLAPAGRLGRIWPSCSS